MKLESCHEEVKTLTPRKKRGPSSVREMGPRFDLPGWMGFGTFRALQPMESRTGKCTEQKLRIHVKMLLNFKTLMIDGT